MEENAHGSSVDNEEAVRVCVRIRPLFENENEPRSFVLGPTENTVVKDMHGGSDNKPYQLNHVYGETSKTQQVYDDMVADIVESVVRQGRNGTVFTYGQTSTGKTFTMNGILMAAGKDLFGLMQDGVADLDEASKVLISVKVSAMELYNEEFRDLLSPLTASLTIQEDKRGNVIVTEDKRGNSMFTKSSKKFTKSRETKKPTPFTTEKTVETIDELMEVIQMAEENRTEGSTAVNERSSRSHTIYRITYEKKELTKVDELPTGGESEDKENDNTANWSAAVSSRGSKKVVTKVRVSTLNLVDLAGSESVRVTGAMGKRQKEGGKINQSLLTLSRVLAKLGTKDRDRGHIGYRDSKLTRILKPSLSGNARMACICCISPSMKFSEESKSTLDFASRTMLVSTNAKVNRTVESECSYVTPKKPKATSSSHVDIDLLHKELAAKTEEAADLAAKLQVAEEKLKHEREESEVLRTAKQELEDQVTLQKADKEFALSECHANATEKDSLIAALLVEQKRQTDKIQSLQAMVKSSRGQLAEKELGNVAKTLMEPVDCQQEVEEQSTLLMSANKEATSLSSASETQMETANGEEEDNMDEGDVNGNNDVKFGGTSEDSPSSTDSAWSSNASRKETNADFGGGNDNFDFSDDNEQKREEEINTTPVRSSKRLKKADSASSVDETSPIEQQESDNTITVSGRTSIDSPPVWLTETSERGVKRKTPEEEEECDIGPKPKKKARLCSYEGCTNQVKQGGVCKRHGAKVKKCSHEGCTTNAVQGGVCIRHGAKRKPQPTCSHKGCDNIVRRGGLCQGHGAYS